MTKMVKQKQHRLHFYVPRYKYIRVILIVEKHTGNKMKNSRGVKKNYVYYNIIYRDSR